MHIPVKKLVLNSKLRAVAVGRAHRGPILRFCVQIKSEKDVLETFV